jgi:hypothetical protein
VVYLKNEFKKTLVSYDLIGAYLIHLPWSSRSLWAGWAEEVNFRVLGFYFV